MESLLQKTSQNARDAQEVLEEIKLYAANARAEYLAAVAVLKEKERYLAAQDGRVKLQEDILASYLLEMYDISAAGLERLGR